MCALDIEHVVCARGDDLFELAELCAVLCQHGKAEQVLNEHRAILELDIVPRDENNLIAQLRRLFYCVNALKLHQNARLLHTRVLYGVFLLADKQPVKLQQKFRGICPRQNLHVSVQPVCRDDFPRLQKFLFHRVSSAFSKLRHGAIILI